MLRRAIKYTYTFEGKERITYVIVHDAHSDEMKQEAKEKFVRAFPNVKYGEVKSIEITFCEYLV